MTENNDFSNTENNSTNSRNEKRFVQSRHRCIDRKEKRRTQYWDTAIDWLNELADENEKLISVNQELRNELKFDEEMYKTFNEIIHEADDLITSHLSKHYQRKWKNFCKHRSVLDD